MNSGFFDLERLYEPIAAIVEQCADDWGFRLHKCPRGNSGWELVRDRDEGGSVFLLLLYDESLGLGVGRVWQYPCEEMANLYTHFRPMRPTTLDADHVVQRLQEERDAILSVRFGHWTHIQPLTNEPASPPEDN